jgi:hypothetical protein
MMSKLPSKRYQSYDELIEHLRFALSKANEALANPSAARTSELRGLEVEGKEMRWISLLFPLAVILGLLVFAYLYFFTTLFKVVE